MTRTEAIARLAGAAEDDADLQDEASELFTALYGREPDAEDGDAGELISLCYAATNADAEDRAAYAADQRYDAMREEDL